MIIFTPALLGQPAASRCSGLWSVCGGGGGEVCPSPGRPAASAGERDQPWQLRRRKCHIIHTILGNKLEILRKESIFVTVSVLQIEEEQDEKGADRLLFSYLTLITKLSKHCGLLELNKPHDTLFRIWGKRSTLLLLFTYLQSTYIYLVVFFFLPTWWTRLGHIEAHLRYPHCWVWLTASQLFGQLFAAHQAEQLVAVWRGECRDASPPSVAAAFITSNLDKKVRPLKVCSELISASSSYSLRKMSCLLSSRWGSWRYLSAISYSPSSWTQHQESRWTNTTKTHSSYFILKFLVL